MSIVQKITSPADGDAPACRDCGRRQAPATDERCARCQRERDEWYREKSADERRGERLHGEAIARGDVVAPEEAA